MKNKYNYLFTFLFAMIAHIAFAQQKNVTGKVTDDSGEPLLGATILVKGTSTGTSSDFDGNYSINVSEGQTLVFSLIGYKDLERVVGSSNTLNVSMEVSAESLDNVIIVGYGTTTKQAFTGSAVAVDGAAIASKSVSNATQALEGEVSGVNIINTSGQPGSAPSVRIRGFGSITGNRAPLYVVDGIMFDGQINEINNEDIKNIVVLKDASATAIYGSRGANGVVLIETKKGRSGESSISVTTRTGVNFRLLPKYSTIKSPEEYIETTWHSMYNEGLFTDEDDPVAFANSSLFSAAGISPKYNMWNVADGGELIDPATGLVRNGVTRRYTPEDWSKHAFQSSVRTETNVNFSGGTDNGTTYYTSFGYLEDKGYSINSDYKRYTMRSNIDQKINSWLKGGLNLGYTYAKSKQNGQSSDSGSVFWFTDNIPSIYPLFARDANGDYIDEPIFGGNLYDYGEGRGFGALTNAIADAHYNLNSTKMHNINMSSQLVANLYEGLTFENTVGLQFRQSNNDQLRSPFYGPAVSDKGTISKTQNQYFSPSFLQILRYTKDFDEHGLEVFAAHESKSWERRYQYNRMSNIVINDNPEFNNGVVSGVPRSFLQDWKLESYFGQVNYDYRNTYYLSGTVRRDGSSRFTKANRWGTFGSIGAGWVVSNEEFIQNATWIDFLKLKASYGLIGDQAGVGYYPTHDLFEASNLDGEVSLSFNTKGNPDLTWETSEMIQVGAEFGIGGFLDGSIDYYRKNTKDQLFDRREPISLGYAIMQVNDGTLTNEGVEFDLVGHIVKSDDFFLDANINGAYLSNKIKKMAIDPATGLSKTIDINGNFGRAEGHGIYDYYMKEWAGVDPQNGVATWKVYYDESGNAISNMEEFKAANPNATITEGVTTNYTEATRSFVGKSAIPKLQGGFGFKAGYKNFNLGVQFRYSLGGYGYDFVYSRLMHNDQAGSNNWHTDIRNSWKNPGDVTDVPRLSNNYDQDAASASTRFLLKSDYLNLSNVNLSYSVPKNIVDNLGLTKFDIFVNGTNLMMINKRKGFNPTTSESGSSDWYNYEPLSTITGGISVTF